MMISRSAITFGNGFAVALLLFMWVAGQAQPLMRYGDTRIDSLSGLQVRVYIFQGSAGDVITIRMSSTWDTPRFDLRRADSTTYIASRSCPIVCYSIRLDTFLLPATTLYAIEVKSAWGGTQGGLYGLYLQKLNAPVGTAITFGSTAHDTIHALAMMKAHPFEADSNDIITLRMVTSPSLGLLPQFEVYDPAGRLIHKNICSNFCVSLRTDSLRLKKTGVYGLLILEDDGLNTGTLSAHIQRLVNPGAARRIGIGQTVYDSITALAATNAYTFNGFRSQILISRMRSNPPWGAYPQFELYDPGGRLLRRVTCPSGQFCYQLDPPPYRLDTTGVFTLLAMDEDGHNTGTYSIGIYGRRPTWVGGITGFRDSSWNNPINWDPVGVPSIGDSVEVATIDSQRSPVLFTPQPNVQISTLSISENSALSITDAVPNFFVKDSAMVRGVILMAQTDTLTFLKAKPLSLSGHGKIPRGTIHRSIQQDQPGRYRFESESTYVRFNSPAPYPSAIRMTAYPATSPTIFGTTWIPTGGVVNRQTHSIRIDSIQLYRSGRWTIKIPGGNLRQSSDSGFVRRVYAIDVQSDTSAIVSLSLRYEPSEVPPGRDEDSLKIHRQHVVTDVAHQENPAPAHFTLLQNYPNPFNPSTKIQYEIATVSHVTIRVYNLLGQCIRTLADDMKPAGKFEVEWHGTNDFGQLVSSGVYLCRFQTTSTWPMVQAFQETRKMVLIR